MLILFEAYFICLSLGTPITAISLSILKATRGGHFTVFVCEPGF